MQLFVHLREVALDLEQQTRQRVGIALHLGELFVVDFQNLAEVAQQRLAFEDVGVVVHPCVELLLLVVFVVDLADDLFENVLERHHAAGAAELIDDNGHVHLVVLELAQQVVDLFRLGHEERRPDDALPTEVLGLIQMGQ